MCQILVRLIKFLAIEMIRGLRLQASVKVVHTEERHGFYHEEKKYY